MSRAKNAHPVLMAWHYTTKENFKGICRAGYIHPATAHVPEHERPVVWFSLNPHFEETARKGKIDPETRELGRCTLAEMRELCGGLVRLGLPARSLLTGEALRRKARISSAMWRSLVHHGIKQGADPTEWFGIAGAVELALCEVQQMDDAGQWSPMEGAAA